MQYYPQFWVFGGLEKSITGDHRDKMDSDSDFGEGDECDMQEANMRKMTDKLSKDGYRIGKAQEEEKQMQIGFDEGFDRGLRLGKVCGDIYAKVVYVVQSEGLENKLFLTKLETLLMDTIPDELEVSEESFVELEALLKHFRCDFANQVQQLKSLASA